LNAAIASRDEPSYIPGAFEKAQLHGRTLWLESGRLVYDLEADQIDDPHLGPLAEPPDVCQLLGP
jgi:hypothetical protein